MFDVVMFLSYYLNQYLLDICTQIPLIAYDKRQNLDNISQFLKASMRNPSMRNPEMRFFFQKN